MEFFLIMLAVIYGCGWYSYSTTNFKKESARIGCFTGLMIPLFAGGVYLFFLESGNFWYFGAILLMAMVSLLAKGALRYVLQTLYFLGMIGLGVLGCIEGTYTYVTNGLVERIEYGWFYFNVYVINSEIVWNGSVGRVVTENDSIYWTNVLILAAVLIFFFVLPLYIWCSNIATTRRVRKHRRIDKIYAKFVSAGITDLDEAERQEDVALIMKHYGIKTTSNMRKIFALGQERAQNAQQDASEQKEQKKTTNRKKKAAPEQRNYQEEKANVRICGKEKYMRPLRKAYRDATMYLDKLNDTTGEDFFKKKKADNWAWVGGLASGIAGPLAGAIAAVEAHERNVVHNAAVEAYNRSMVEAGFDTFEIDRMLNEEREHVSLQKSILSDAWDEMNDKILVDTDPAEKMTYLQFEVVCLDVEQNALHLQVDVSMPQQPCLLGKPAVLDGSVRIDVLNEQGSKVGETYYNAPGFDAWEMDKVGFGKSTTCKIDAVPVGGNRFSADNTYTFKVSPVALWLIECDK